MQASEIRYGIARLPDGRRKQVLLDTADDIFRAFSDQVLPFDTAAAEHYATIASIRERAGKPIPGFDALIAAVCRSRAAALATRNLPGFEGAGILGIFTEAASFIMMCAGKEPKAIHDWIADTVALHGPNKILAR